MKIIKFLMIIFLFCVLIGYCVQHIEVPEDKVKEDNIQNPKPDRNRIPVDYDWTNGRYIYQDEIHKLIKTGNGYILKDSFKTPDYMKDTTIWKWAGDLKEEEEEEERELLYE